MVFQKKKMDVLRDEKEVEKVCGKICDSFQSDIFQDKALADLKQLSYNFCNGFVRSCRYATFSAEERPAPSDPFICQSIHQREGENTMDMLTSNSMLMMERSLQFLWTKQSCILDNLSNVETPGYKTKYATFEESLENAIRSSVKKNGSTAQVREAILDAQIETHEADNESTRMDDNGVNVTEQMVEMVRNGYQQQYVMKAISSDFSVLMTAIRG